MISGPQMYVEKSTVLNFQQHLPNVKPRLSSLRIPDKLARLAGRRRLELES